MKCERIQSIGVAIELGDTGSLALGATMGSIAILTRHEILLILIWIVFVIETLTCIIQRVYYKFTHKRLFLMTPIHHSFEKKGYSERDIVKLFCIVGILASMIAIIFGVVLWLYTLIKNFYTYTCSNYMNVLKLM